MMLYNDNVNKCKEICDLSPKTKGHHFRKGMVFFLFDGNKKKEGEHAGIR